MTDDPIQAPGGHHELTVAHWIPDGSGPPLLVGATVGVGCAKLRGRFPIASHLSREYQQRSGGAGRTWISFPTRRTAPACCSCTSSRASMLRYAPTTYPSG